jgi:hypothetical protein
VSTLAACTDDPPPAPHELVGCDEAWVRNGYVHCEGACESSNRALLAQGPSCDGRTSNGPVSCQKTFEYEDAVGCCISSGDTVLFADCN